MTVKDLLGKKWAVIIAHPDDESYLFAGSIYRNWQTGGSSVILCATHGGRGSAHMAKNISEKKLKEIRKRELLQASRVLKADKVFLQNIPDCECDFHKNIFLKFCLRSLKLIQPDLIVSFNADGFTGHKDHVAAFSVAKRASRHFRIPLFSVTMPPALRSKAKKLFGSRQKNGTYIAIRHYAMPHVSIRINSTIKRKALLCHSSQLDRGKILPGFPKSALKELFSVEHFIKQ